MSYSFLAQIQKFKEVPGALEKGVPTLKGLEVVFNNVVTVILGLAGVVLFIMLLLGGFSYITSGGDPKKVESARNTLTYAIGGVIFIALAYLILKFIEVFTGVPVTEFKIFQ
jgi:hypothetical protein